MKSEKHLKKRSPAGIVSVKGGAEPARDQTTQDLKSDTEPSVDAPAPIAVSEPAAPPKPAAPKKSSEPPKLAKPAKTIKSVEPVKATKPAKIEKKPLNFKVAGDFRREFKTYASTHDLKLNRLLELAFESYRKQRGD
jgi:hypothetical protein